MSQRNNLEFCSLDHPDRRIAPQGRSDPVDLAQGPKSAFLMSVSTGSLLKCYPGDDKIRFYTQPIEGLKAL